MSSVLTLIGRRKKSAIMHLSECLFRVIGGFLVSLFRVKIITYIELGFWKRFFSVNKNSTSHYARQDWHQKRNK
jgi:hypothetical protein